ncbi:MAG: murein biosynthesis integral membrane protein MurJ [Acidobacteria bacterium]|nr:murein biosynthesis integral membrane protein MurJ [Acidobacteriota bacterium]
MAAQGSVFKNSAILAFWTACSRVFGLVREMVIAALLGTSRWADIWNFSFMVPNMFRRFFAEGALSSALIPILAEVHDDPEKEKEFARAFFSLVLLASTVFTAILILLMPVLLPALIQLTSTSLAEGQDDLVKAILPTQIMFPFLIFVSMAAVCQGLLNVHNRFALAAATPILLNVSIIAFGLGLQPFLNNPFWGLCAGVLVGGIFQFVPQWIALHRQGISLVPSRQFWTKKTRESVLLWAPMTIGAGIYQVNLLLSQSIAFSLSPASLSALTYSNRLMELVLGVFATALGTSLLPHLAKEKSSDLSGFSSTLFQSMEGISVITLPASIGLMVAGYPIVALLFKRGAFDQESLNLTYIAVLFHAMSILPLSWYRVTSQAFFAMKQTRLVMILSLFTTVTNISLCYALPHFFPEGARHAGIACATLGYSWALVFISFYLLHRRWKISAPPSFGKETLKMVLASLMVCIPWWPFRVEELPTRLLFLKMSISICLYLATLKLLKSRGLIEIEGKLKRRLLRNRFQP